MLSFLVGFLVFLATAMPGRADTDGTVTAQPAKIVEQYNGGFKDDYPQELVLVRSYVPAVQSEVATQLGLQYGQGFRHPVILRFDDGAPSVNENPFFYVVTKGSGDGFSQDVVANVEAYVRRRNERASKVTDMRGGLRYALARVMLNDLMGEDSNSVLPLWVQEGLAVYASGSGDNFVRSVSEQTYRSKAMRLASDLNSPAPYPGPKEWASYYLAIKYISANGTLQTFVQDIARDKSAADAVRDTLSQEWPVFEANVRKFSSDNFAAYAIDDEDADSQSRSHSPAGTRYPLH